MEVSKDEAIMEDSFLSSPSTVCITFLQLNDFPGNGAINRQTTHVSNYVLNTFLATLDKRGPHVYVAMT